MISAQPPQRKGGVEIGFDYMANNPINKIPIETLDIGACVSFLVDEHTDVLRE